ncbi:MAG: hypothetical protein WAZ19_11155 [Anaerolineae bacterium]
MTEQQEPNQQTLAELAQTLLHLSRALDEAHNLASPAVEDLDFAITEWDELREQVAELRAERDEVAVMVARVEKLAAELESWGGSMASALAKALRAALRGEVPA